MKYTNKSTQIDNLITEVFGDRKAAILNDNCNLCKQEANTFKDELSAKEYSISGMCQVCQDKVFG